MEPEVPATANGHAVERTVDERYGVSWHSVCRAAGRRFAFSGQFTSVISALFGECGNRSSV